MKKRCIIVTSIILVLSFSQIILTAGGEDKVITVKNKGKGVWEGKRKAVFEKDTAFGAVQESENHILYRPKDVIADKQGNIYVLDKCQIKKYARAGAYLMTIGKRGEGPGEILNAQDIEFDGNGNILVFDWMGNRISTFSTDGKYIGSFKAPFLSRYGAVDSKGDIYIYSYFNGKLLHKFSPGGKFLFSFVDAVKSPTKRTQFHVNSLGKLFITKKDKIHLAVTYPYTIYVCSPDGKIIKKIITATDYAAPPYVDGSNNVIVNFSITGLHVCPQGYIVCRNTYFPITGKFTSEKMQQTFDSLYLEHSFVDIFDPSGRFLVRQAMRGFAEGGYMDERGNFYCIVEDEEGYNVTKYTLRF